MRLEVYDPDKELDAEFGQWLCKRIQKHILSSLDSNKLKSWDTFFQTSLTYTSIYGIPIKTQNIFTEAVKNIVVNKLPDKIVISLNGNKYMPGLDRVKLHTLVKLITFGNISTTGYPVFTDSLQYFADNINDFVELYERGL